MASPSAAATDSVCTASEKKHYKSYSFEDRLKVIRLSESGMSSLEIGNFLDIDSSLVRGWIRRYKKDGFDGLKPRSHKNPSLTIDTQDHVADCIEDLKEDSDPHSSGKKGFIHYVDNPVLVRSMVNTLSAYGVHSNNIVVSEDIRDYSESLEPGDILVINSLFDISSDLSRMLSVLQDLLKTGISVVSISDKGQMIKPGNTDSVELVSILKNYLSIAWTDLRPVERKDCQPEPKSVHQVFEQRKEERFSKARRLCEEGYSMAHAARTAGCSYSSFRYWLTKKKSEHQASLINE